MEAINNFLMRIFDLFVKLIAPDVFLLHFLNFLGKLGLLITKEVFNMFVENEFQGVEMSFKIKKVKYCRDSPAPPYENF